MTKPYAVLVALAAVMFAGLMHGIWSSRWQTSEELEHAVERVAEVPANVGDWTSQEAEVNPEAYAQTGALGYWMRRYKNQKTGSEVTVILMCGPTGRMSVHTPNICYQGAGFLMQGEPARFEISYSDNLAQMWTNDFYKQNAAGDQKLRIFWLWNAKGEWQAPDNPRFHFRGQPALYKLYVVRDITFSPSSLEDDPAIQLLNVLLPQMQKTLFTPPSDAEPQAILQRREDLPIGLALANR